MKFTLTLTNPITYKPEDVNLDCLLSEGEEICFKYHDGNLVWSGRKTPLSEKEKIAVEQGLSTAERAEETLSVPSGRYSLTQVERVSSEDPPNLKGDFYLRTIAEKDGKTVSQILLPLF